MAVLIQLILVGVFVLIVLNIFKLMRTPNTIDDQSNDDATIIDGVARDVSSPGKAANETLKDLENIRVSLKTKYPAVVAMFGGYLNSYSISEAGSLESAVKEMIVDWTPRRDAVAREITKLLAENNTEEEVRAIIISLCDADFEQEGHRAWLTWLLGQFNSLGG